MNTHSTCLFFLAMSLCLLLFFNLGNFSWFCGWVNIGLLQHIIFQLVLLTCYFFSFTKFKWTSPKYNQWLWFITDMWKRQYIKLCASCFQHNGNIPMQLLCKKKWVLELFFYFLVVGFVHNFQKGCVVFVFFISAIFPSSHMVPNTGIE